VRWVEEAQSLSQTSLDLLRPTIRKPDSELWFTWNPRQATTRWISCCVARHRPRMPRSSRSTSAITPGFLTSCATRWSTTSAETQTNTSTFGKGSYLTNSQSRVFKNWKIDDFEAPRDAIHRLGADWGFAVDPTVLVRCHIIGRTLYIDYEAYMVGCEIVNTQFDNVQTALRDERLQCLQDRRFYSLAGAQWEGPLWDIYENKPKFEVNKVALAVMRIISEYRNNRITVDFVSKDGAENDKLADTCDGLYRADEHDSVANEAYDNAFEEAVGGGFGAWRLRTTYEDDEDEDNERQRIQIEPIFDADSSVFFDLNAKRQDKADARFCYVIYSMTYESYKEEWNDDPTDWPKIIHQYEFDWCTPDVVYIAEYYKVEDVTETIRIFRAIDGTEERYKSSEFTDDPALEETLAAIGSVEVRQRKIKSRKIHKYIMSGGKVLEDCGYIAGKCIPIVPVYGKRWFVDNVERCMGHVRLAKDAQRLKNMQLSKLGEISALSSVEKPILTPEQIAGHQLMWAEDNLKDYPYLLINPITNADGSQAISGPVAYTRSPAIPPAMAALLQVTEQDMQDILGNPQAGEKVVSNVSGKAVEMIQQRLDMQTFIYMSNFAKAMKRCGEIWLSMAKDVYVEEGAR
jgi:hypothetical protein